MTGNFAWSMRTLDCVSSLSKLKQWQLGFSVKFSQWHSASRLSTSSCQKIWKISWTLAKSDSQTYLIWLWLFNSAFEWNRLAEAVGMDLSGRSLHQVGRAGQLGQTGVSRRTDERLTSRSVVQVVVGWLSVENWVVDDSQFLNYISRQLVSPWYPYWP